MKSFPSTDIMSLKKNIEKSSILYEDILNEATSDEIWEKYYNSIPKDIFEKLIQLDPTYKPNKMGKYGKWIINMYNKGYNTDSDLKQISHNLQIYNKYINKIQQKDINKISSLEELSNIVSQFEGNENLATSKSDEVRRAKQGSEKVFEDSKWIVIHPFTKDASIYYGKHTRWCTSSKYDTSERNYGKDYFDDYNSRGKLFININKETNKKYQFFIGDDGEDYEFKNEIDIEIDYPIYETMGMTRSLLEFYEKMDENLYRILTLSAEEIVDYVNTTYDLYSVGEYGSECYSLTNNAYKLHVRENDELFAIIIDNNDEFILLKGNDNKPLWFISDVTIRNGLINLIQSNGKSFIYDFKHQRLYDNLPNNSFLTRISFENDNCFVLRNKIEHKESFYYLHNKKVSKFSYNIYSITKAEMLKGKNIIKATFSDGNIIYYDFEKDEIISEEKKNNNSDDNFKVESTLKGFKGISIVSNSNGFENLIEQGKEGVLLQDWYRKIEQSSNNRNILYVLNDDGETFNMIDLYNPFKFILPQNAEELIKDEVNNIVVLISGKSFIYRNDTQSLTQINTEETHPNMNNKHVIYITEEQYRKHLLTENRESKNINLARKYVLSKGYDQEMAQKLIDEVRTYIPNSRIGGCKFLLGVTRMYLDGELSDQGSLYNLNKTLYYVGSEAHINEYDNNLNDLSAEELNERFTTNIQQDLEKDKNEVNNAEYVKTNHGYQIVPIETFEEATQYSGYTDWCVTRDERMFNSYTHFGLGKFYFCLKDGFESVERIKGENVPLDEYGLSMIAISVNEDGSLNTCTCRWNHENGGNDNIMDTKQISELFGQSFYELFLPKSEEEIEAVKQKVNNDFYAALNDCNKYDGDYTMSFEYYDSSNDDDENIVIVSPYDEGDVAIIYKVDDGIYDFLKNDDEIVYYKHAHFIEDTIYLSLIERKGKSYIFNTETLTKVIDLPNNTYCLKLLTYDSRAYADTALRVYDIGTNDSYRIINLKNNKISENYYKGEIYPTTKDDIVNIKNISDKPVTYVQFDLRSVQAIESKDEFFKIDPYTKIKGIYSETYSIVVNDEGKKNLYNKLLNKICLEEWYDDIYQVRKNWSIRYDNLLIVCKGQGLSNMIDLNKSNNSFVLPQDFTFYQINDNPPKIYFVNADKTVSAFNLDTMELEKTNVQTESINYKQDNKRTLYITEGQYRRFLLNENRESKNINLARRYVIQLGNNQEYAQKVIDDIRFDIPNSRVAQSKFLLGVTRMYMNRELSDPEVILKLNRTLPYIGSEKFVNNFDNNLNDLSAEDVISQFTKVVYDDFEKDKEEVSKQTYQRNNDYEIVRITSFDEAKEYAGFTDWCVTHDKNAFDSYTSDGLGVFYFCLKKGYETLKAEVGENAPFDEYGMSMIAISVNPDGSLNTCTSRWNHENKSNDFLMGTKEISQLFGVNFYDVFKPYSEEEMRQKELSMQEKFVNLLHELNTTNKKIQQVFYHVKPISPDFNAFDVCAEKYGDVNHAIVLFDENYYKFLMKDDELIKLYSQLEVLVNNKIWVLEVETNDSYVFEMPSFKRVMNFPKKYMPFNLDDSKYDQLGIYFLSSNSSPKKYFVDVTNNRISEAFTEDFYETKKWYAVLGKSINGKNTILKYFNLKNFEFVDTNSKNKSINENIETEVNASDIDPTPYDKKNELNPKLWANGKLNPKVRLKLLDIADEFWFGLGLEWVEVKDIIITGSMCSYNWSDYSDIDLHIIIDFNDVDDNLELVREYMNSIKNEWNENHMNLSIYGFPIELYIQDKNEHHVSEGEYSLEKNKWIKEPQEDNVKPIGDNEEKIKEKSAYLMTLIDELGKYMTAYSNDSHRMELVYEKSTSFINKLRKMRRKSLDKNGEMSVGNLVYKIMRQNGYIDKLYKIKYDSYDYFNSIV